MNNFEKTIRDTAQNMHLLPEAKARMRERVMEYTTYKPLRHTQDKALRHTQDRQQSVHILYGYVYRAVSVALIAMLVVGGAGTAYASQDALPGDALYGVKEITEAVRSKVSVTDESRIAWNIERAQRRLDEARALAARNALTQERDEYLAQKFNALIETVETDIQTIQKQNEPLAQALSLDLEFGVQSYVNALERTQHAQNTNEPVTLAAARVRAQEPELPPQPHSVATVATMAAFSVEDAPVPADTQEEPIIIMAAKAQPEETIQKEDSEDAQQKAIEALTRTVARQEARLKKEAEKAQERAQQEAQATIRAIEAVREHIEQKKNGEDVAVQDAEHRAFLEAALGEVHDARVRIKVEIEGENSERDYQDGGVEEVRSR